MHTIEHKVARCLQLIVKLVKELAFDQDFDHSLRGSAQSERVLRTLGTMSMRKNSRRVSSLSATATICPSRVDGIESSMLSGL